VPPRPGPSQGKESRFFLSGIRATGIQSTLTRIRTVVCIPSANAWCTRNHQANRQNRELVLLLIASSQATRHYRDWARLWEAILSGLDSSVGRTVAVRRPHELGKHGSIRICFSASRITTTSLWTYQTQGMVAQECDNAAQVGR